jgi:hypothetical protein
VKVLQKDWLLDAAALNLLLTALDPEREAAAVRYENVRKALIRYFSLHGSLIPDENADEVFNRVARKLSESVPLDLSHHNGYFLKVAHFVLNEYFRSARRQFVPFEECAQSSELSTDPIEESARLRDRFERELGLEAVRYCRDLLSLNERENLDAYDEGIGREKIDRRNALAAKLGKSKGALIVEISRIRARVRNCTLKKLRELGILESV